MRLRFVAKLSPSVTGFGPEAVGDEISFLPLERIWADNRFDPSGTIEYTGDVGSYNAANEGDLLLPKVSPTFAHGRCALAKDLIGGRALATSEVFVIRANDPADVRFLQYRLLAPDFLDAGQGAWLGVAGLKRVSAEFVKNVRIDDRAWLCRRHIADFLDRECGRIDVAVRASKSVVDRVDAAEEQLLSHLLADLPQVKLSYRFEVQLGKMLDEKRIVTGDTRAYLRNTNVQWRSIDTSDLKRMTFSPGDRRKYALRPGDLLVCEGGEIGRCAVWQGQVDDVYFQKALHRVRPLANDSTAFLQMAMRWIALTRGFASESTGSAIPHLPAERLRQLRVPLCDPPKQSEVVERADLFYRASDRVSARGRDVIRVLVEYRDSLIHEAVTGKLDVTRASERQMEERLHAAIEGRLDEVVV